MKTKVYTSLASLAVLPVNSLTAVSTSHSGYLAGGIIALLIMGYLLYALFKPEKF
jgi:K+-transporting ATPase KdpF subunit